MALNDNNVKMIYIIIPYSGNFRMVQNIALFADGLTTVKIRTAKPRNGRCDHV